MTGKRKEKTSASGLRAGRMTQIELGKHPLKTHSSAPAKDSAVHVMDKRKTFRKKNAKTDQRLNKIDI